MAEKRSVALGWSLVVIIDRLGVKEGVSEVLWGGLVKGRVGWDGACGEGGGRA